MPDEADIVDGITEELVGTLRAAKEKSVAQHAWAAARRSAGEPPREPREPLANGAAAAKRRKSAALARMRRWRRPPPCTKTQHRC